ncbi:MAG TPA: GrlR family regulatory protein [Candidatus Binataceae bacterium]|nr:GrlR family regulatory protein [Candidatus Binataceae bacterium]
MRDGLYRVQFHTQLGIGAGVVLLQGSKLRGGDSRNFYIGTYAESGTRVTAQVTTDKHTDMPGLASVFGADPAHISLAGTVKGDSAEMTGTAAEAPGISFRATLTRIAD